VIVNHYQNYRTYVRSRSDWQLYGKDYSTNSLADCAPRIVNGTSRAVFLPCGLIAGDTFNDTFVFQTVNGTEIPWVLEGVAWDSDLKHKFKNPPVTVQGYRVIKDFHDPVFVNHMRVSSFPWYRKLHRVIHQDLRPGVYYIIARDLWPVQQWDGQKYVFFSTTTWLGGKQTSLGLAVCFIVVGILSLIIALAFLLKHIIKPRALGDDSYIKWFK